MPRKGYKQTKEHKKKSSLVRLGKRKSDATKKKMSESQKKNPVRYWLGKKLSSKTKQRMSLAGIGRICKEETRKKMSGTMKKGFQNGRIPWMKGKKREKHPKWKGGYERKLWLNNQRRIKKLGNGGSHTLNDWDNLKAQYNWTCPCCKRSEPEITLSRDHIIPLSKGGSDLIENIQPLCRSCNSKKHDKNIKYVFKNHHTRRNPKTYHIR